VAKEVAVVEAGHGDFGDNHFQESAEGGEDTESGEARLVN
jgi:hypothetical protein